jgi:hypothetical protein
MKRFVLLLAKANAEVAARTETFASLRTLRKTVHKVQRAAILAAMP